MQVFNRHVSMRSLTVFAGELLLIFGSVALAASLQQHANDLAANVWKISSRSTPNASFRACSGWATSSR